MSARPPDQETRQLLTPYSHDGLLSLLQCDTSSADREPPGFLLCNDLGWHPASLQKELRTGFLFSENPIAEITDQDVSDWLEDIGKICGESGEIIETDENGMVHMKFKYGKKEILPMGALTDNPEEKAEKVWWEPSE